MQGEPLRSPCREVDVLMDIKNGLIAEIEGLRKSKARDYVIQALEAMA